MCLMRAAIFLVVLVGARLALAAGPLAPLPADQAVVVHGPYAQGACDTCHERADVKDPGPAKVTNATCLACHDEFEGRAPVRIGPGKSHPRKGDCVSCHNPHNSRKRRLLL
jgi:predicted CXXCH cytochrome family protein